MYLPNQKRVWQVNLIEKNWLIHFWFVMNKFSIARIQQKQKKTLLNDSDKREFVGEIVLYYLCLQESKFYYPL